jgi:adenosylcobinamide-GDP ribazoletransferase
MTTASLKPPEQKVRLSHAAKFAITASYITRLPLSRIQLANNESALNGLAKYLPAVGLLIGAILAVLNWLLCAIHVQALLSAGIITVAWLMLTGGIHFDGLMDTADGVFSQRDQKRMLEIMSDSRVGNFGAMTGWCVLLLKFVALSSLPPSAMPLVLVLVPSWSRWCESYAIGAFPYLKQAGMGKVWHDTTRFPHDVLLAALAPLAATVAASMAGALFVPLLPPFIAFFAVCCGLISSYWLYSVLSGQTGDTYGAVVELSEVGALLLLALLLSVPALRWLYPG